MNDLLSTTYGKVASRLNELAQDGPMTVATFTECCLLLGDLLRLSVRTTEEMGFQVGLENWRSKSQTQEEKSARSYTRKLEPPTQENSLRLSHSSCSCCFSEKRDTDNA